MTIGKLVSSFPHCKFENHRLIDLFQVHLHAAAASVNYSQNNILQSNQDVNTENLIENANANAYTWNSIFQLCKHIDSLKNLHAHIVITGLHHDNFILSKLVTTYAMFGSLEDARQVFEKMRKPDSFLWNMMIREYAKSGLCTEGLRLYCEMHKGGIWPDNYTFCSAMKACASLSALQEGTEIHVVKSGFQANVFVSNSLVNMYAKCGDIDLARQVFDRMPVRDMVSWNTLISGCAQNGLAREALVLFDQMQQLEMEISSVTIVSVLQACSDLGNFEKGQQIHDYVTQGGLESNVFVGNSLIDMYAKCKKVDIARQVFDKMPIKTVVSWSAIIAAYAQNEHATVALELFAQMQLDNVTPNSVTMVSVLQAFAHLGDLEQGKRIRNYIVQSGLQLDIFVENSLIAMYAKCGSMELANELFGCMSKRDLVSWNAMIAGYTQNGHDNKALAVFNQMQLAIIAPDSITLMSMFQACACEGTLQQGKWIHCYIIQNGFDSDIFVLNSFIDMYAKCGNVEIARQVFDKI